VAVPVSRYVIGAGLRRLQPSIAKRDRLRHMAAQEMPARDE